MKSQIMILRLAGNEIAKSDIANSDSDMRSQIMRSQIMILRLAGNEIANNEIANSDLGIAPGMKEQIVEEQRMIVK